MSSAELKPSRLDRNLARAKRFEDRLRDTPFLPVGEKVNGVEVKQFTLRHLILLLRLRSPFLCGGKIRIEDVGTFMWVINPHFSIENPPIKAAWGYRKYLEWKALNVPTSREVFLTQLVCYPRWGFFYRGIRRYIKRAFHDSPPETDGGTTVAASFAAGLVHKIAT